MKSQIRRLVPKGLLNQYHKGLAVAANIFYGRPSEKLAVIGVTGTNGKSTTCILIAKILEEAGHQVGVTSTAIFKVGKKEWLNDQKMTMLGRFALQKLLRQMVVAGCDYAVIETSSEGIKQHRHLGIHYDVGVFTNLTPEHLESHGGFENYKKAKLELFEKIKNKFSKNNFRPLLNPPLETRGGKIKKVIIANGDDEHAKDFLNFNVEKKIVYGLRVTGYGLPTIQAADIKFEPAGTSFMAEGVRFNLKLFGLFNVYNSLAAISVAVSQGIDLEICRAALEKVSGVPGRMEFVETGRPFAVLVDYAPEPESMCQLYETIKNHQLVEPGKKIIHVLGSCGGGRDKSRRPVLGELAARNAAIVIVTNEDPYDEDPNSIIEAVAQGAINAGKVSGQNLFKVADRAEAIKKAIGLAVAGDLVLLTGKGCEQAICVENGRKIPWDEREVVRKLLR